MVEQRNIFRTLDAGVAIGLWLKYDILELPAQDDARLGQSGFHQKLCYPERDFSFRLSSTRFATEYRIKNEVDPWSIGTQQEQRCGERATLNNSAGDPPYLRPLLGIGAGGRGFMGELERPSENQQYQPAIKSMSKELAITFDLLERLKSPKGGYSRASLNIMGISWPPPRGWRKKLIAEAQANLAKEQAPLASADGKASRVDAHYHLKAEQAAKHFAGDKEALHTELDAIAIKALQEIGLIQLASALEEQLKKCWCA